MAATAGSPRPFARARDDLASFGRRALALCSRPRREGSQRFAFPLLFCPALRAPRRASMLADPYPLPQGYLHRRLRGGARCALGKDAAWLRLDRRAVSRSLFGRAPALESKARPLGQTLRPISWVEAVMFMRWKTMRSACWSYLRPHNRGQEGVWSASPTSCAIAHDLGRSCSRPQASCYRWPRLAVLPDCALGFCSPRRGMVTHSAASASGCSTDANGLTNLPKSQHQRLKRRFTRSGLSKPR